MTQDTSTGDAGDSADTLEQLIYRIVGTYIRGKLDSKHELTWDKVKECADDSKERKEYNEKKLKIGKEAFFAVRSRTGADFVDYFSGTLCSVPHRLGEANYAIVARALLDEDSIATVRTLTLLALSARS